MFCLPIAISKSWNRGANSAPVVSLVRLFLVFRTWPERLGLSKGCMHYLLNGDCVIPYSVVSLTFKFPALCRP